MTQRIAIANARIFDGSGALPFSGTVVVEGDRIRSVLRSTRPNVTDALVIDAAGSTLMPGLIEAHADLGFGSTVEHRLRRRDISSEQRMLRMAHAAHTLLNHGFTSVYSGGSANARAEVELRDAIREGYIAGPRVKASSFERSASAASFNPQVSYAGYNSRDCDIDGIGTFVEEMARIGVDSVKFVVAGESGIVPGASRVFQFYEAELAEASRVANKHRLSMTAHCRSAESIKLVAKLGFRVLHHCTGADEEALDLLEARKKDIFVTPAPGISWANLHEGGESGAILQKAEMHEQHDTLERVCEVMPKLRKRGVRVLPGGDYGSPWNPIGKNARDLALFVKLFGFSPAQALRAATKEGGELMGMGHELGMVKEGYLADLLLVSGDPLADIGIMQDAGRLLMIMQNGRLHKAPRN